MSHRQFHTSVYTYLSPRDAAICNVWNEHFLWQPAHLIHLTLKKMEHPWQTGQWKIEPWILIVEVNEQIGLEVCHLSVSRDALVWLHPGTPVSPVTSWRKRLQSAWGAWFGLIFLLLFLFFSSECVREKKKTSSSWDNNSNNTQGYVLDSVSQFGMHVYLFKYSWQEGRRCVCVFVWLECNLHQQ